MLMKQYQSHNFVSMLVKTEFIVFLSSPEVCNLSYPNQSCFSSTTASSIFMYHIRSIHIYSQTCPWSWNKFPILRWLDHWICSISRGPVILTWYTGQGSKNNSSGCQVSPISDIRRRPHTKWVRYFSQELIAANWYFISLISSLFTVWGQRIINKRIY